MISSTSLALSNSVKSLKMANDKPTFPYPFAFSFVLL